MNNNELQKTFPYGAMLIPDGRQEPSTRVRVHTPEDTDAAYFVVWRDPYRDVELSRNLSPFEDGFKVNGRNGLKYFLRPLAKEQEPNF